MGFCKKNIFLGELFL